MWKLNDMESISANAEVHTDMNYLENSARVIQPVQGIQSDRWEELRAQDAVGLQIHKPDVGPFDIDSPPMAPTHIVSLSCDGVHFAHQALLHPDEPIGLRLTLFPSGRLIVTTAVIVSANDARNLGSQPGSQDSPNYRAAFIDITDADKRVLENHVEALLSNRTRMMD